MHLQKICDSTIDETVEVNFRLAQLTGVVRKQMWIGLAVWGSILFVVPAALFPYDLAGKMGVGGLFSLVFIVVHLLTFKKTMKKNYRKHIVKLLGTDKPIPCEYELTDTKIGFHKLGISLYFDLNKVIKISNTAESIEINLMPSGLMFLPKRVFSESECDEWVEYIKSQIVTDVSA
ncbi:MAG: hypothetical protein IPQ13_13795 [Holophagaceae bacterium]|nr:hypothetical protein [Holophagaceae bacterium]